MTDVHGSIHWTELMTRDVAAARAFYETVCGWQFAAVPMDFGDYWIGTQNGRPVIGIMDMAASSDDDDAAPFWMTYFGVDDVDAAVAAVIAAGGTVKTGPYDIPDTGRIAIVEDPTGALVGLMTPPR